jgi:hypothetical protein
VKRPHIARWDLDKTYLRTEFDTMRDLVRTAFERADQKRTNPGASTLLREMQRHGVSIHILSGSPEQMRKRLEDKLRLDGIEWDSFVLKPNLKNMLKLRFRAVRDQLGYKLPALLDARVNGLAPDFDDAHETLFGDDAEADAFVYSLYADVLSDRVSISALEEICKRGRMYEDVFELTLETARRASRSNIVERILIHLEKQTPPEDFAVYGTRVVPFYNYLQAAFVVHEDTRVSGEGVLRVAAEMVNEHRFEADQLVRSYRELLRRGHLRGTRTDDLAHALEGYGTNERASTRAELEGLVNGVRALVREESPPATSIELPPVPDYASLVGAHNRRRHKR